jgi:hypothetical protein
MVQFIILGRAPCRFLHEQACLFGLELARQRVWCLRILGLSNPLRNVDSLCQYYYYRGLLMQRNGLSRVIPQQSKDELQPVRARR